MPFSSARAAASVSGGGSFIAFLLAIVAGTIPSMSDRHDASPIASSIRRSSSGETPMWRPWNSAVFSRVASGSRSRAAASPETSLREIGAGSVGAARTSDMAGLLVRRRAAIPAARGQSRNPVVLVPERFAAGRPWVASSVGGNEPAALQQCLSSVLLPERSAFGGLSTLSCPPESRLRRGNRQRPASLAGPIIAEPISGRVSRPRWFGCGVAA